MKEGQEVLMGYKLEEVFKDKITIYFANRNITIYANGEYEFYGELPKWHKGAIDGIVNGFHALRDMSVGDLLIGKEEEYQGKAYLFLGERKETSSSNIVFFLVWDLDAQQDDLVYLHDLPKFKVIEKGVFYE